LLLLLNLVTAANARSTSRGTRLTHPYFETIFWIFENMRRFLRSASLPSFLTHTLCLYFSEQVSSHQTTNSMSSGQQRTTFETTQIEPLLEQARAKQGGSLPDVEAGEANLYWSHS
jgi:hypothetical protein